MQEFLDQLFLSLPQIEARFVAAAAVLIPLLVSYHIVRTKTDVRAAIGWVGLVWLVPFVGALLYLILGVNRIQRKALRLHAGDGVMHTQKPQASLEMPAGLQDGHLGKHVALLDRLDTGTLCEGNKVDLLRGGEETFPDMIAAIDAAEQSILLASYIIGSDVAGKQFAKALAAAAERGVEVRVLIDGIGEFYHWPLASRMLRRSGVQVAKFNGSFLPWRMAYLNLRNHRKIMVVDGQVGFTGGMNLRDGNLAKSQSASPVRDVHFRVSGPVVSQMIEVFAEDWHFATGESLPEAATIAPLKNAEVVARGISDGPDEDLDMISWALRSILAAANHEVRIVTPYFLPDRILMTSLAHAALRGVEVSIYLPEKNNLRVVAWAANAQYEQLLQAGCRIFHTAPPFDHSKLMTVDGIWTLLGSTNWDPRSLRLNFEFNLECFSAGLAASVNEHIDVLAQSAREISIEDQRRKNPLVKFRNGMAWLFSPYL